MVINDPKVTLDLPGGSNTDLSDHVIAATFDAPSEVIDARTFGKPYASDVAAGMQSVTLAVLWSPTLAGLLATDENTVSTLTVEPKDGAGPKLTAEVEFAYLPFGELAIGAQAEADLVLAVTDVISYSAS